MRIRYLLGGACALLLLLPLRAVAENILVDPMTWDYGEVEIGATEPMTFTITSMGPDTALRVDMILIMDDDTGSFEALTAEIDFPVYLEVGESIEVVVNFTPDAEGMATASLLIISNAHNGYSTYIPLQGEGVIEEPTPGEMMEQLIDTYEEGVEGGGICGLGMSTGAVTAHLRVFAAMLDAADDLIELGDVDGACDQLAHAERKCDDPDDPPPNFIGCDLAPAINAMIREVREALGCD